MTDQPLVIAYFDGDKEVQLLSNFAYSPFELDGIKYFTVEAFWQSLKFVDPIMRAKVASLSDGWDAKQMGHFAKGTLSTRFEYKGNIYKIGSSEHHFLLERALRAKTEQNEEVQKVLLSTGNRLLLHRFKTKYGAWRPGDSPALPASMFEFMWMLIRTELQTCVFRAELPLPDGIQSTYDEDTWPPKLRKD